MTAPHPPARRASLRRATEFLAPARGAIAAILAIAVALAALNAAEPLALRHVFDGLAGGRAGRAFAEGVIALVALGLLREGLQGVSTWLTWRTRIGIHYRLTSATVERLHRLPLTFHRAEGVGAVMTRLDRSIQGLVGALSDIAFNVVPAAVYLVLSVAVMARLEWRLALLVVAFAPLPALIARLAAPMQTRRERTLLQRWVRIYSRFNEVLSGIVTVKSFAMESAEKKRFLDEVNSANAAARAANAHDFIGRLPEGYDTVVGERGSRLSVGERQRIAIARALLKAPPILILDEPTSALDAESEQLVQQALDRVTRGRTTLVIAHRLSTVVDADRIVVLRQGRIVEDGRHADLLARGGYYASLVEKQARGLLPMAA